MKRPPESSASVCRHWAATIASCEYTFAMPVAIFRRVVRANRYDAVANGSRPRNSGTQSDS